MRFRERAGGSSAYCLANFDQKCFRWEAGVQKQKKEWGIITLPIVIFSLGWWYYFSLMASQPLGAVTDDTCLPAFRAVFSSVVIAIDLDRFKQVDDENGHIVGDRVLKSFFRMLVDAFRKRDFIARVGGDEFLVTCEDLVSETSVKHRIGLLEDKFAEVFGDEYPYLNWSWGSIEHTGHLRGAIDIADKIMYQHKQSRTNG